ncbi:MAG: phage tail protein [Kofleriaceae bacterium]
MSQNQYSNRAYSAAHFGLMLNDENSAASKDVGLFRSIEGGGVRADVMSYQAGGSFERWRQLGAPKFEDIKIQVGMAMSQPFYQWIADFFAKKPVRKNGSIFAADFYYAERAVREFNGALIKELTFPALSGADKSAVYMSVAMAVEEIKFKKGSGAKLEPPKGFDNQKLWTAANFTFSIDGYADACKRVTKVDSFTIKQNINEYRGGGSRLAVKTPTVLEFPNITFYVPEADAQPFFERAKAGIVEGAAPADLQATLHTYDNSGKELFSVQMNHCDIVSAIPDKSDASTEEIKQVKVEIYTQTMEFTYAKAG